MSQENVEIVRGGFNAWQPDAGTWRGPEGLLEAITSWFEGFDNVTVSAQDFIDANDTQVIVRVLRFLPAAACPSAPIG